MIMPSGVIIVPILPSGGIVFKIKIFNIMPSKEGANQIRLDEAVVEFNGFNITKTRDDLQPKNKYIVEPFASETCPAPMTRAALIALRAANGLLKDCDYVITDHVQGRLVAGTTIHLQAVSANELSENVQVNTTYDNEAWQGIYDIDRALVLELQDNRNNIARGINGVQVTNFDWGNTSYNNVVVDNATLTADIGNVATKNNITIDKAAILNITGFIGVLNNITFSTAVNANFSNANGTWRDSIIKGGGTFNISGYTGGGDNYYNEIDGNCNINYSNSSSTIILRQNKIISSTLTHTGVSTGNFNIANSFLQACTFIHSVGALNFRMAGCTATRLIINNTTGAVSLDNNPFLSNSTITQNTANGTISLTGCNLSTSTITNSSATILTLLNTTIKEASGITISNGTGNTTITSTEISTASQIIKNTNGTGTISITSSNISGGSVITHSSAVIMVLTRVVMESASTINSQNGSGGNMNISDTKVFTSSITKFGTSNTGTLDVTAGVVLTSSSFISHQGTGNLSVSQSTIDGSSGINITAGDRSYNCTRLTMNGVGRANLSGTGLGILDTLQDLTIVDRGLLTISCSGAANSLLYSRIAGLSAAMTLSGTTGGKTIDRAKCNDGSLNIPNNPNTANLSLLNISDAGIVNLNNNPVGQSISYLDVSNASVITISKTGIGLIRYIDVRNNGNLTIQGITTSVEKVSIEQGPIIFNGGSALNISKKMSGLWTINGGLQTFSHHWTTANRLTSGNNTARVDYLGVNSTVPIL